jgi:hypothetical protein
MAVDGGMIIKIMVQGLTFPSSDTETCSFTLAAADQRWWQIQIKNTVVDSVAVAISPGSFQHFTIFVIELLEGSKALYKPCSSFKGTFDESVAVFLCNDGDGHKGEFVYIRDDREEEEYFGLCEVQVFPLIGNLSDDCLATDYRKHMFRAEGVRST